MAAEDQLEAFADSAQELAFDKFDQGWYDLGELDDVRVRFIREKPELLEAALDL